MYTECKWWWKFSRLTFRTMTSLRIAPTIRSRRINYWTLVHLCDVHMDNRHICLVHRAYMCMLTLGLVGCKYWINAFALTSDQTKHLPTLKEVLKRKKHQLTKVHFTPVHSVLFRKCLCSGKGLRPSVCHVVKELLKHFVRSALFPNTVCQVIPVYWKIHIIDSNCVYCIELFPVSYTFTRCSVHCRDACGMHSTTFVGVGNICSLMSNK